MNRSGTNVSDAASDALFAVRVKAEEAADAASDALFAVRVKAEEAAARALEDSRAVGSPESAPLCMRIDSASSSSSSPAAKPRSSSVRGGGRREWQGSVCIP